MIEYQEVWKSFGDNHVLKGVDLRIEEGETFFILGKTGEGKSVMIRLLVGLLNADQGRIYIDNQEITNFTEDQFQEVRMKCGMVFQFPTLFDSMSVGENVAFALNRHTDLSEEEIKEKVVEDLALVGLEPEVAERLPMELSFGMQKRVGLARTIAMRPRYLLYDEPTTGLDPFTSSQINKLMLDLNRKLGVTSIVVSHDLHSMMEVADRVALLSEGKLVAVSRPEEFVARDHPLVQEFVAGLRAAKEI